MSNTLNVQLAGIYLTWCTVLSFIYFSEPYTPYDVEITPVTQLVGQGETTRQTLFTQEGGKKAAHDHNSY